MLLIFLELDVKYFILFQLNILSEFQYKYNQFCRMLGPRIDSLQKIPKKIMKPHHLFSVRFNLL